MLRVSFHYVLAAVLLFGTLPCAIAQPPETTEEEGSVPTREITPEPDTIDITPEPDDFDFDVSEVIDNLNSLRDPSLRSQFDSPLSIDSVGRETIDRKQATSPHEALQNEVGVLMQKTANGQSSPFIRGLTGQQVLILIDGIRLNNSTFRTGPNQYFNTVDAGQIQRIDVIRGSQSTLWGSDAIGGVINIVTRSAESDFGNYHGGSFNQVLGSADSSSYSRANVEGWAGNGGVFAGGSYLNVRDLDTAGDLGRQPFTNYSQYAGDVKYNYMFDSESMITFALQHFEQEDLPRSDRFEPFVSGPPARSERPTFFDPQQRDLAYVRWQATSATNPLYDAAIATVSYSRQKEGTLELRPSDRLDRSEFDVDSIGVSMVLARDFCDYGKISYGVDYYYDDVDAFRLRESPPGSAPVEVAPQFPDDAVYDRFGVFLNWDFEVNDRLNMTAAVRYENINASGTPEIGGDPTFFQRNFDDVIGSLGFVYELSPCWNLVGGVQEGFRAPNLDDLTADNTVMQDSLDVPSLDVDPEHSINYEVGFKIETDLVRLQVVEFWTDLSGNILREPTVDGNIRANFDSFINGTELSGEVSLDCNWTAYGNFWYTYGKDLDRDEPLSRIPPTQGILGLRWEDDCQRSYFDVYTWLVRRQDRYAAQNLNDARFPVGGTPGYGTLNLRIGTKLGRCDNHRVGLSIENITDKDYRVLGSGVDGAGFNARLGYEYIW